MWEVYILEEDIEHRGMGQVPAQAKDEPVAPAEPVVWEHRLGQPIPRPVPMADNSVDEVRLRGTFNVPLSAEEQQHILKESLRMLRPGGQVLLHQLVADRPLTDGPPRLPGPAAWVRHVPVETEPVRLLESAGFVQLQLIKLGSTSCFQQGGVEMRECQLVWHASRRPGQTMPRAAW